MYALQMHSTTTKYYYILLACLNDLTTTLFVDYNYLWAICICMLICDVKKLQSKTIAESIEIYIFVVIHQRRPTKNWLIGFPLPPCQTSSVLKTPHPPVYRRPDRASTSEIHICCVLDVLAQYDPAVCQVGGCVGVFKMQIICVSDLNILRLWASCLCLTPRPSPHPHVEPWTSLIVDPFPKIK